MNVNTQVVEMFILPCRWRNQSITRMNNNEDQSPRNQMMNTMIFLPRFTCLPASYSSLWWFTHLEVHVLIGITHQTLNRVPHNQHKMRITQATSNLLKYLFGSPPGKSQEPLTITTIRAEDNHQPPLNDPHCSKPSRWRQPPRVTSESRSETRTPSASRCKHSNNALGFTPNLTKMMNQWWRWVGGLWLSSQGCYVNANGQESELEPAIGLK